MPRLELVDYLPRFLDEIAGSLRRNSLPDRSETAADHGMQRLALGFNLDSVVREYGALRDAVVEAITGIADAVSEYGRERDAELQRQANEHFAFVAHELRNPLGTATTAVAILRRKTGIADDRAGQALQRALSRMNELIESTLQVAQIGAGVTLRRERVSLSKLLEDAEMGAVAQAEEKEVRLDVEVERDAEVSVDPRLVSSALTNLVRNAVKFTPPGSSVRVRAKTRGSRTTIEVEDCCGGLPPGAVEKAFTPFAQVGADRSGFGLGLAIAKQAADAHGGAIRVQNLPGKGCIFVLELPVEAL